MAIEFLYFDLGGVLLSFSHDLMCRQMAATARVDETRLRSVLFDGGAGASLQWRLERGDITCDEAYRHFCEVLEVQPDRDLLYAAGSDIFAPIDETIDLARRLRAAGQRMGILSNTNPHDWGFVTAGRFPFLGECFPLAALSYEARAMKPEAAIFRYAAALAGVEPSQIFFTDDREDNVAGALDAGFDAVIFRSADQLAAELRKRGVEFA